MQDPHMETADKAARSPVAGRNPSLPDYRKRECYADESIDID